MLCFHTQEIHGCVWQVLRGLPLQSPPWRSRVGALQALLRLCGAPRAAPVRCERRPARLGRRPAARAACPMAKALVRRGHRRASPQAGRVPPGSYCPAWCNGEPSPPRLSWCHERPNRSAPPRPLKAGEEAASRARVRASHYTPVGGHCPLSLRTCVCGPATRSHSGGVGPCGVGRGRWWSRRARWKARSSRIHGRRGHEVSSGGSDLGLRRPRIHGGHRHSETRG